jgi:protein-S-isoprenylcysteine O-methyltransferase Ste14
MDDACAGTDTGRMQRNVAAVGSSVFMALAPGTVAGLVPWWLTGWHGHAWWPPARVFGGAFVLGGGVVLVQAFISFVVEGLGTPAPVAPTEHLVVGGLYRYVRNPMYLAVVAVILGQALLLGRLVLVVYAVVVGALMWAFATWYEVPALTRQFGEEYQRYRSAVPGWWPRLTPWTAADPPSTG